MPSAIDYINRHYSPNARAYCIKELPNGANVYKISDKELVLDTQNAVKAESDFCCDVKISSDNCNFVIDGYLYMNGANSFAANIYVGVESPDGTEKFYYATQRDAGISDDIMIGRYGSFSCTIEDVPEETSKLNLYLESKNILYKLDTEKVVG